MASAASIRIPVFKDSPFYVIQQQLTPVLEIKVREGTRDTIHSQITFSEHVASQLIRDLNTRIMIYCASDALNSPFQKCDIAFPYQLEIKINQDELKANLRGLKNKPGSTRPADITRFVRKVAGYENKLQVTYALTTKKYFLIVNLVKQRSVEELVATLKTGKHISSERVIREMITKAEDKDIVATSSIMSLKCPLSTLRMNVPCRSTVCSHNQCFDATSYLQLQEQAPTWTCPICNKLATFSNLQIDQYVNEILRATPGYVDQVVVEPDGKWSQCSEAASHSKSTNGLSAGDTEDDIVEIDNVSQRAVVKSEHAFDQCRPESTSSPLASHPPSSTLAPATSSSKKRTAEQVVDLTISSDEDDEPTRGPKRQVTQKLSVGPPGGPILDDDTTPKASASQQNESHGPYTTDQVDRAPGEPFLNYR